MKNSLPTRYFKNGRTPLHSIVEILNCVSRSNCMWPLPSGLRGAPHWKNVSKKIDDLFQWSSQLTTDKKVNGWCFRTLIVFNECLLDSILTVFGEDWILDLGNFDLTLGITSITDVISSIKSTCLFPASNLFGARAPYYGPFTNSLMRYYKNLFRTRISEKKLCFVNTALQLKRVCPKVPPFFVDSSIVKFLERVQLPPRQDAKIIEEIHELSRSKLKWLRRNPWSPHDSDPITDLALRSCYENSQEKGGVYGFWRELMPDSVIFKPASNGDLKTVVAQRGIRFPMRCEMERFFRNKDNFVLNDKVYISEDFTDFTDRPLRKVIGITEPLKVRIITVGHAWESPFWAEFQHHLQDQISTRSWSGTGRTDEELLEKVKLMRDNLTFNENATKEPWTFMSDDGSAATDSIDCELTWKFLSDLIPNQYHDFAYNSLRSYVRYKKEFHEQNTGQMMGDRRSFPLLCLIHYAFKIAFLKKHNLIRVVYTSGSRNHRRFIKLYELILVNGDDGLIAIPLRLKNQYIEWMNQLWEMNLLKTYEHRDYASFNSQLFDLKEGKRIPLIRYNLIRRVDKFGDKCLDPSVWNQVVKDCPNNKRTHEILFRKYCLYWKDQLEFLKKLGGGNNYFLPKAVGGFGLNPGHLLFEVTPRQYAGIEICERSQGSSKRPEVVTSSQPAFRSKHGPGKLKISTGRDHWSWDNAIRDPIPSNHKDVSNSTKLIIGKLPKFFCGKREWKHLEHWKMNPDPNSSSSTLD